MIERVPEPDKPSITGDRAYAADDKRARRAPWVVVLFWVGSVCVGDGYVLRGEVAEEVYD